MFRIHPSENKCLITTKKKKKKNDNDDGEEKVVNVNGNGNNNTVLTVWKRSSMSFQGTDGFTVYDRQGRLVFRVENYSRSRSSRWSCVAASGGGGGATSLVLMDGSGNPLLTLKPQIFSMQHQWNAYLYREDEEETTTCTKPSSSASTINTSPFIMRRPSSSVIILPGTTHNCHSNVSHCEAQVLLAGNKGGAATAPPPDFRIEGSFWRRNCLIKSTINGEVVAKIMRKRASGSSGSGGGTMLSDDVFSLVVKPGFDPQLIMAFVVILDGICFKPFFTPHLICI